MELFEEDLDRINVAKTEEEIKKLQKVIEEFADEEFTEEELDSVTAGLPRDEAISRMEKMLREKRANTNNLEQQNIIKR